MRRAFLTLASVAWLAAVLRVLTADIDWLLGVVPDDTFYYLLIARNLAHTGRSTFDGVSATNGYHPLWMAVLVPLAGWLPVGVPLLRVALAMAFACQAATAALILRGLRPLVGDDWAYVAAGCWLINPLAFSIALTATEGALYAAVLMVVFLAHQALRRDAQARRAGSLKRLLPFAFALGVLCLTRTDGIIVATLSLMWLVVSGTAGRAAIRDRIEPVAITAAIVGLCIVPWWLFSLVQVGSVTQDSGAMKMLWAADALPNYADRLANLNRTLDFFGRRSLSLTMVWHFSWWTFALCATGLVVMLIGVVRHWRCEQAAALRSVLVPALVLALVYGFVLVERQVWWLALPGLALMLTMFIAGPTVLRLTRPRGRRETVAMSAVMVCALAVFGRWHVKGYTPYPWQPDVRRSQLAIADIVPAGQSIGCFNAGIPAFFGPRRVVALDGLVSHQARQAWETQTLDDFIRQRDLHFVADEERIMAKAQRFMHTRLELEVVGSYPLRGWPTGARLLWRLR